MRFRSFGCLTVFRILSVETQLFFPFPSTIAVHGRNALAHGSSRRSATSRLMLSKDTGQPRGAARSAVNVEGGASRVPRWRFWVLTFLRPRIPRGEASPLGKLSAYATPSTAVSPVHRSGQVDSRAAPARARARLDAAAARRRDLPSRHGVELRSSAGCYDGAGRYFPSTGFPAVHVGQPETLIGTLALRNSHRKFRTLRKFTGSCQFLRYIRPRVSRRRLRGSWCRGFRWW
jgi:hypothetical protein